MFKKISLILISIILIFFFIRPSIVFAQETEKLNWPLEGKEAENLLDIIRKEPLTEANRELFFESLQGYNVDAPRKTGAVVLVKQAILKEQLDYWFKEVPKQVSIEFLKVALKVVRIVYAQDIGTVIETIEQITVERAIDYAVKWLFQNEIKIGAGEASYIFPSYKRNTQKIDIQYIIVYHSLNQTQGKIAAEFYSKNSIEPPLGTSPDALARPADHPKSNPWPWDIWIENERKRDNDGKLEPFIVRVKGYVKRDRWGNFEWDKSKGEPTVEVDFDKLVPELEAPIEFWEKPSILTRTKLIIEKIKEELTRLQEKLVGPKSSKRPIKSGWERSRDFFSEIGEKLKETTWNLLDKIGSYLLEVEPGAQIVSPSQPLIQAPEPDLTKLTEEALSLEKIIAQAEESLLRSDIDRPSQVSLEELIEEFDEISERAEIVLANAQEFLQEETTVQIRENGVVEEKLKEEVFEEILEEEFEEKLEESLEGEIVFCSISGSQYPARNRVIFNEIAWMGTINSSNDEWMELKNISGSSIDLSGWQILDKNSQIKIVLENSTVVPGGFLLLERTDDDSVPRISADLIYTGALNNTDEALYLFDENCQLQDKVLANPYWTAGNNSSKKTMERKNDLGWQTSSNIDGTPKAENSPGETYYAGGEDRGPSEEEEIPTPTFFPILINEIMYNLEGNDEGREWIEIFNATTTSVDLTDWKFYENETNHNLNLVQGSNTLSPGEYAVIADKSEEFLKDFPDYSRTLFDSYFSLHNTGESLAIKNGDLLIDQVNYSSEWGADGNGNSLQKIDPEADSGESSNWKPAPPTPGEINSFPEENQLPTALFTYSPLSPQVDEEILFNASSSTDPDGQIVSYLWDFGDGNSTTTNLATTTHLFANSSQFLVSLIVQDNQGTTSTEATSTIQVTQPLEIAQTVVISEVQVQDEEFVELYNPTDQVVTTTGWYLSYFSANRDWSDSYRNIQFPTTTIAASSYFLIGLKSHSATSGYPTTDWQIDNYTIQLSNTAGAIGFFSCNPKEATTSSEAMACKIDVVGWGNPIVKEGNAATVPDEGKSLTRKQDQNGNYIDNDDNLTDFEIKNLTPTNSNGETGNILPPEPVQNFQVVSSTNNTVALTWSTTTDPDTPDENISYFIYYSKDNEITTTTLNASTTEIATTSTTSTLTIDDLYYNSTYYFGIRASDGLNWSELTTITPISIAPEIPQWQMFGHDAQRTFRSPYAGTSTSTVKWSYGIPGGNNKTGIAIDQNGTIYLQSTSYLLAITEEGNLKWQYPPTPTTTAVSLLTPLIGPDGAIYIVIGNKLLAVSPRGELKWGTEINPSGNPYLVLDNNIVFFAGSYLINGNRRPLLIAFNSDDGNLLWIFDLAAETKYNNFGGISQTDARTRPSIPTLDKDNNVYVGYGPTLFAFDSNGSLLWKKTIEVKSGWENNIQSPLDSISVGDDKTIYFVIKDKAYEKFIGGTTTTEYANFLYALKSNSIDNSTTSITGTEIKWNSVKIHSGQGPILIAKDGTLYLRILRGNNDYLWSISQQGTTTEFQIQNEVSSFLARFIDDENKIYGKGGGFLNGLVILNSQGEKILFDHTNQYIFPFALSNNGTLYAPTSDTLFAFGQ